MTMSRPFRHTDPGTDEPTWLLDDRWDAVPARDARELVTAYDRIVLLAPHPDDECLGAGGLLATALAERPEHLDRLHGEDFRAAQTDAARRRDPRFRMGILICFAAGLLATLFNIALAYGAPIAREAVRTGADPFHASNAVWSLAVSLGSLPSLFYTTHKLRRNRTWPKYGEFSPARNGVLCVLMGVMWISSTVLYGSAAGMLGPLGTVIGWPIYMSSMILANNFWGWATGEWKRAGTRAVTLMAAGIAVQIAAMVLFGRMQ